MGGVEARVLRAEEKERTGDVLVAMFRGVIQHRREEPCYGPLVMSDDQAMELARAMAQHMLAEFAIRRGRFPNRQKTHCPQGHPYSGDNVRNYGGRAGRQCVACNKIRSRNWSRA